MPEKARELLKKVFGYTAFRPGQEKIIGSILNGEIKLERYGAKFLAEIRRHAMV